MPDTKEKKLLVDRKAPVLRAVAKALTAEEIGSAQTLAVIARMKKALHAEEDGVAIAAPQIGESLRLFVVSGRALALARRAKKSDTPEKLDDLVFINPEIVKTSQKKKKLEEGCLSLRYLYGKVLRYEKVTIQALDEKGLKAVYGASGLLAHIFQHEIDHLNGILFTDKAEDIQDVPPLSMVFFGSSRFSSYVLEELEKMNISPVLKIESARDPLPVAALQELDANLFVVASFGKILPKAVVEMPRFGTLNVHPSLLPALRGASPIQSTILTNSNPGVTIIKMDEKMDHGPVIAQEVVPIEPWPDHYATVEEKLGHAGGRLLAQIIPAWIRGEIKAKAQGHALATFTKMIKKEDGLIDPAAPAVENWRKVLAYSTWPGAYMFFKSKTGKEIRLVVKEAEVREGKFTPVRVIPAGKREMTWKEFLLGNA